MIGIGIGLTSRQALGRATPATTTQIEIVQRDGALVVSRNGDQIIARAS